MSIGDPIQPHQLYSIRIDHGVIAEMTEFPFAFRRLFTGRDPMRRVGEIAILANTFEFAAPSATGTSPNFSNLANLTGVKVVYYNADVEQGQALSFSNIPLTEGRVYEGRPVGIQIIVLELDRMSGPLQSLMRTLAQIGQQSSALPSGVATQALLDLGASLISQDNDDVMFEYRFVLDYSDGSNTVTTPPFEAGRYVLRRTDERRRVPRWDDLVLDHNTGQLMQANGTDGSYLPFDQDTYFTLNIVRHPEGHGFAYNLQTLEELGKEINDAAAERDAPIGALAARLGATLVDTRNRQTGAALVEAWRTAASQYRAYARLFVVDSVLSANDATCVARPDADRLQRREDALFQARHAAMRFIALYDEAIADRNRHQQDIAASTTPNATNHLFEPGVQSSMLAALSAYFSPFDIVTQSVLADPAQFQSTYTGANAAAFAQAGEDAAKQHWAPQTCAAMIEAGLADPKPTGGTG